MHVIIKGFEATMEVQNELNKCLKDKEVVIHCRRKIDLEITDKEIVEKVVEYVKKQYGLNL